MDLTAELNKKNEPGSLVVPSTMLITDITYGPKSRQRIFINEKFAFVLYKGELHRYGISIGAHLPDETYQEIHGQILPKRARNRAFHLIGKRSYTEKQIRQKLIQGEYPIDIIDVTIDYLKSFSYIDDTRYTRDYIEYHLNQKSRIKIRHDLSGKGIPYEITDAIYSEFAACEANDIEAKQISKWLIKKEFDKNTADLKEKQRIFTFLYRKGFTIDTINHFLKLDIR
jgi:regulatory protein